LGELKTLSTSAFSSTAIENQCGSFSQNPWFLIRTKPCQEDRAQHFLSLLGVEVFLPLASTENSLELRPFFPGYIFGSFPDYLASKVNNAFGVRKIVKFGMVPAMVPDSVIADLREMKLVTERRDKFQAGDRVAVTAGAFKGWYGVFDSELSASGRVRVLLETLSANQGYHQQTRGLAMSLEINKLDLMLA
jgi:transcription antitermination factor NusG